MGSCLLTDRLTHTQASLIEDAGLNASAPPQQRWLDGWLLRLSPGKAKRARCIHALAPGRLPWLERLRLAREAFAEAQLPLIFRLTPFSQPSELGSQLEALGFTTLDDTRVMACEDLATQVTPLGRGVELRPLPPLEFAEFVGRLRGSPPGQRQAHGQRLLCSPVRYQGFGLLVQGELIACGQFAREEDRVGLYDVFTDPAHRGQGWAGALCVHLLARAAHEGAKLGYLQVEHDNAPARTLYRRLGFFDVYAYHYRAEDPLAV